MPRGSPGSKNAGGIGLCLAGGGYPGAFFEFGAVAALEAALPGWKAVDSGVIVGTSSGAVVGAVLSLGVTSTEVVDALSDRGSLPLAMRRRDFSRFPWERHARGWGKIFSGLPGLIGRNTRRGRLRWGKMVAEARGHLPAGLFSNQGVEELLAGISRRNGRSDRFQDLDAPLLITATDLDSGERAVFGREGDASPAVSLAVRASSAIPGYFDPVSIGSRDYIDGQIFDPIHLDLAAMDGVCVIFAVSPLNPYVRAGEPVGGARIRGLGTTAVFEQSARISAGIKRKATEAAFRANHPGIPILAVEPTAEEVLHLMRVGFARESLLEAWKIGFRAAARRLRENDESLGASLPALGLAVDSGLLARAEEAWGIVPAAGL